MQETLLLSSRVSFGYGICSGCFGPGLGPGAPTFWLGLILHNIGITAPSTLRGNDKPIAPWTAGYPHRLSSPTLSELLTYWPRGPVISAPMDCNRRDALRTRLALGPGISNGSSCRLRPDREFSITGTQVLLPDRWIGSPPERCNRMRWIGTSTSNNDPNRVT